MGRVHAPAGAVHHVEQQGVCSWVAECMRPASVKDALVRTYADVVQNHTLQMAAALAYYFVLSFFPALIFLSAVVAFLPVPDVFNEALALMARFLPADSM